MKEPTKKNQRREKESNIAEETSKGHRRIAEGLPWYAVGLVDKDWHEKSTAVAVLVVVSSKEV